MPTVGSNWLTYPAKDAWRWFKLMMTTNWRKIKPNLYTRGTLNSLPKMKTNLEKFLTRSKSYLLKRIYLCPTLEPSSSTPNSRPSNRLNTNKPSLLVQTWSTSFRSLRKTSSIADLLRTWTTLRSSSQAYRILLSSKKRWFHQSMSGQKKTSADSLAK